MPYDPINPEPLFYCERCGMAVYEGGNYPELCDGCLDREQAEHEIEQERRDRWEEEYGPLRGGR